MNIQELKDTYTANLKKFPLKQKNESGRDFRKSRNNRKILQ